MSILPMMSDFAGLVPGIHGGSDGGEGGLLGLLDGLLNGFSGMMEPGGWSGAVAGILALGYNVHPMLVHFPIALLTAFLFMEIMGAIRKSADMQNAARWLLYLGAMGAVAAAGAGIVAEHLVPHGEEVHAIMERHEVFGLTVASLSVVLALWRFVSGNRLTGMAQGLHWFIGFVIAVSLFFGADLGGLMVYQHGVGVKTLQDLNQTHSHEVPTTTHRHTQDHHAE